MYINIISHYRVTFLYRHLLICSKSYNLVPGIICHTSTNLFDLDHICGPHVGNFRPNYKIVDKKP